MARTKTQARGYCTWSEDEEGVWDTGCDERFVFIDGGPDENRMSFCCYCGNPLKAKRYAEEPLAASVPQGG